MAKWIPRASWMFAMSMCLLCAACARTPAPGGTSEEALQTFAMNDDSGVLTRSGVAVDANVTTDGGGSLRLDAEGMTTFRLFEVDDIDIESARLIYRANLRTENLEGQAYLEMWCRFPGKGEFFSRALHSPVSGTTEWTTQETPFFLQAGENPDMVKLNLVVAGKGTVWIDDVSLSKGSL